MIFVVVRASPMGDAILNMKFFLKFWEPNGAFKIKLSQKYFIFDVKIAYENSILNHANLKKLPNINRFYY